MTEILLSGGVTVDIATKEDVEAHARRLERLLGRPHARFTKLAGSVESAGKPLIVDLGRPPQGMMWEIQWLLVTGVDPFGAAIANVTAAAFVGAVPLLASLAIGPPVTGLDYASAILTSLVVPSTNAVPDKSVVYTNESLYVIFTGTGLVAGGARYRVVAGVIELEQRPDALMW